MRNIVAFTAFLFCFASCDHSENAKTSNNDSLAAPSVKVIPEDSLNQNMPVKPIDTSNSDMPVLNPDTGKVIPK